MRRAAPLAVAAVLGAVATAVPAASGSTRAPAAATAWDATTVASGLDSPRGLAFDPDGALLVAEAGHGGDSCVSAGPLGQLCIGTSSQISKVDTASGAHTPMVTGLFSQSITMEGITGVDGISSSGDALYGAITAAPQQYANWSCDGQPADCATSLAAARDDAGRVITFTADGSWKPLASVGSPDFDLTAKDPTLSSEGPNANPYAVLGITGGVWVADSGANLLSFVTPDGQIHLSSRIVKAAPGGFPADGVPTCLAMLRGNLYAGDLAGRLWKRAGQFAPTQVTVADSSGKNLLHHVTGCTSDGMDDLYLVDMWGTPGPPIPAGPGSAAGTGSVVELSRDGTATVIATGLDFPNGIALAKDGSLYVSDGSTCTASGTPFPYCAKGGSIVHLTKP